MLNIDEIRAVTDKATPGPWSVKTNRHPETTGQAWGWIEGPCDNWCWTDKYTHSRPNAEFVARARQWVPALCDEVEADRARIKELEKALELACNELKLSSVEKVFAPDYFIQQAQEQDGKK